MKTTSAFSEASPYKSVVEELERLRKTFRSLNQRYTVRIETEINELRIAVLSAAQTAPDKDSNGSAAGSEPLVASAKRKQAVGKRSSKAVSETPGRQINEFHDLRDMLTLLRTFEVDPGVAKRRDFKRVENMLEELQLLARHWA